MWLSEDQRLSEGSENRAPSPALMLTVWPLGRPFSHSVSTAQERFELILWAHCSVQSSHCPASTLVPILSHTQVHIEEIAGTPWEERLSEKMPIHTQAWEVGEAGVSPGADIYFCSVLGKCPNLYEQGSVGTLVLNSKQAEPGLLQTHVNFLSPQPGCRVEEGLSTLGPCRGLPRLARSWPLLELAFSPGCWLATGTSFSVF